MGRRVAWWGGVVAAVWLGLGPATTGAATLWENLLSQHRIDADPQKDYPLQEEHGPWLIMACSFSGDGAEDQAREVGLELRKRYKLPAYIHHMKFDFDRDTGGRGVDPYGEPVQWRYQHGDGTAETAVLVGHFTGLDDPAARGTLRAIKYATPECLETGQRTKTNQTLAGLRELHKRLLKGDNEKKKKGPMGHAFLVPNPLRGESPAPRGIDPLVIGMNKGLKYSLLECPGKYTVQVAKFTGKVIVDQAEIRRIESGKKDLEETRLDEAAEKAHKLTLALRAKGYEAYEYHERYASIVTVGSFESVGTPRSDGQTEIHPQIHRIMETFKGRPIAAGGAIACQLVNGIPLDLQPQPVVVPKPSITMKQAREMARLR